MRVVHLDVRAHLDGKNEINVTLIETPRGNVVVEARPKGKRLVYKGLLSEAVKWFAARPPKTFTPLEGGRTVHLSLSEDVDLDGQSEASVELIEVAVGDFAIQVRAKHQRTVYTGLLSDVAMFVAARHSKFLAQQNGIAVPKPRRGLGRLR